MALRDRRDEAASLRPRTGPVAPNMQVCLKHDPRNGKKCDVADCPRRHTSTDVSASAAREFDEVVAILDKAKTNRRPLEKTRGATMPALRRRLGRR